MADLSLRIPRKDITLTAGTSCVLFAEVTTGTQALSIADADSAYYRGGMFAFGVDRTICRIRINITKTQGDISGKTYVCKIWTLSGNNLDAIQATSTGVTGSNAWSYTDVDFDFPSPFTMTASTTYGVTLDIGGFDASNFASVHNAAHSVANWGWARWLSDKTLGTSSTNDLRAGFYAQV